MSFDYRLGAGHLSFKIPDLISEGPPARLDGEGRSQVSPLPTDSLRFQKAMEAYDGELGELWFTNLIGGNPFVFLSHL